MYRCTAQTFLCPLLCGESAMMCGKKPIRTPSQAGMAPFLPPLQSSPVLARGGECP